jgi:hypothetical protein
MELSLNLIHRQQCIQQLNTEKYNLVASREIMNTENLHSIGNVSYTSQSTATHGPKIKNSVSFLSKSSSPKHLDRTEIDFKSAKNHLLTTEVQINSATNESCETEIPEEFEQKGGSTNSSTSKDSFGAKTVKSMLYGDVSVAKLNTVMSSANLYSKSFHHNNSPTNSLSAEKSSKGSFGEKKNTSTIETWRRKPTNKLEYLTSKASQPRKNNQT